MAIRRLLSSSLLILWHFLPAVMGKSLCFTCEGPCWSKDMCNCQTGLCEADYCFSERRRILYSDGKLKYQVAKGCMKRPLETKLGCDYLADRHTVFCVCKGNFCNDAVLLPPASLDYSLWNTSCLNCPKAQHCLSPCMGSYCRHDLRQGTSSCGYGSPLLPFTYRTDSLLQNSRRKTCVSVESGSQWSAECICNRDNCNRQHSMRHQRQRSVVVAKPHDRYVPLYTCWSCHKQMAGTDTMLPTECHKHRCTGEFCILSLITKQGGRAQRGSIGQGSGVARIAGCFNTTQRDAASLGCTQLWRTDAYERIECLCKGDYCNSDLHTAHINGAGTVALGSVILCTLLLTKF